MYNLWQDPTIPFRYPRRVCPFASRRGMTRESREAHVRVNRHDASPEAFWNARRALQK